MNLGNSNYAIGQVVSAKNGDVGMVLSLGGDLAAVEVRWSDGSVRWVWRDTLRPL